MKDQVMENSVTFKQKCFLVSVAKWDNIITSFHVD